MKNYGPIIRNATEILHGGDYTPDQRLATPEIIARDIDAEYVEIAPLDEDAIGAVDAVTASLTAK